MEDNRSMLNQAQEELGLNQKELGVYIGVSTRTVNSWMTRERECPAYVAEMALRLAQVDRVALEDDEPTTGDGDEFITVCGSKADAIREAEKDWKHLLPKEQERRARFQVALIHVAVMEREVDGTRFTYFTDHNGHIDGDTYAVEKNWK